jgi:O-acetyl-ADP-ribose deacetylase (regulator of RNase III)
MASARGEVVETPTQDLPFKAVVSTEGKILRETYFASRQAAEAFPVSTLEELAKTEDAANLSPTGTAAGAVVETPTQDLPFKAVISTEGKSRAGAVFRLSPGGGGVHRRYAEGIG